MKLARNLCLTLLCTLPLAGCNTANLIEWVQDKPSVFHEPDYEYTRGIVKPFVWIVGFPVAFAVDVAFFPFQIVSGCYPYSDCYMRPEDGGDV